MGATQNVLSKNDNKVVQNTTSLKFTKSGWYLSFYFSSLLLLHRVIPRVKRFGS